jgi:bifunctional non-homologous end joining protein LigD
MPLPAVAPMLAVARSELPTEDTAYGYEFKWDGVRAIVYVEDGRARVLSRNDRDVSVSYPELASLPAALGGRAVILDGEIVALDAAGRPSFSRLQSRMHVTDPSAVRRLAAEVPARLLVFDVLHLGGTPTIGRPYEQRRDLLDSLALDGPHWQTPPWFSGAGSPGEGEAVFAASKSSGLEGVVAKRLGSHYFPGRRSDCWLKVKHARMQEVVVGGWKPGQGRRTGGLGSLLLGVYDETGLRYAGHVGTGFTDRALRELQADLAPLAANDPPFAEPVPREHARDARWVRPELVGEVVFTEWTQDGRLRHPSWRGLRPDKAPAEVVREPG